MSAYEAGASPEGLPPKMQAARYFDGDQYMPRKFSPAQIWELQQILAQMGLLTGSFQREIWDEPTANAYAGVLAYANQQGLTEQQALMRMGQDGGAGTTGSRYRVDENGKLVPIGEEAGREVPPLVTRTTDPKVVQAVFRKAAIELLGQGWSREQITGMQQAYTQMEEQRQRDLYEAQIRESGTPQAGSVVDIPSPEAFAETYITEKAPEDKQEYEAMRYASEAAQLLGSTAWGI
jgi:hypothetical protein